jgi:hypothetical protein
VTDPEAGATAIGTVKCLFEGCTKEFILHKGSDRTQNIKRHLLGAHKIEDGAARLASLPPERPKGQPLISGHLQRQQVVEELDMTDCMMNTSDCQRSKLPPRAGTVFSLFSKIF